MAGIAVVGTATVAPHFGMPDWAVIALSAAAGSGLSAGFKLLDGSLKRVMAVVMSFVAGIGAGIAMANIFVTALHVDPQSTTAFAFTFALIGASFTKGLATGDLGESIAAGVGKWLRRKAGEKPE